LTSVGGEIPQSGEVIWPKNTRSFRGFLMINSAKGQRAEKDRLPSKGNH
jgi:hypothetical protein